MIKQIPYQLAIIDKTIKAIDEGHKRILIESATGSGKTIIGQLIAKTLYERGWKTGWTTLRRHLITQASKSNEDLIKCPGIEFFTSLQNSIPKNIDVLIIDEAHHAVASSIVKAINISNPKIIIGLTATPFRTDEIDLCFSIIIRDADIQSLISQGWLSKYRYYMYNKPWNPYNVSALFHHHNELWGKSIIFMRTVEECYECQNFITSYGYNSEAVHAKSDQDKQIDRFINDEVDVLINVGVLTEGFSDNAVESVFIRPSSEVSTIQMAGRALRLHDNKNYARIIQNHETRYRFTKAAIPDRQYYYKDDKWMLKRTLNPKINEISRAMINRLGSKISRP